MNEVEKIHKKLIEASVMIEKLGLNGMTLGFEIDGRRCSAKVNLGKKSEGGKE